MRLREIKAAAERPALPAVRGARTAGALLIASRYIPPLLLQPVPPPPRGGSFASSLLLLLPVSVAAWLHANRPGSG